MDWIESLKTRKILDTGIKKKVSECVEIEPTKPTKLKKPYLKNGAELIIPTGCPDKYKWWEPGGQNLLTTLLEINAPDSVIDHYVGEPQQPEMWKRWQEIMEQRIASRPGSGPGASVTL